MFDPFGSGPGGSQPSPTAPGFYGKAPLLGDFISRRLPAAFVPEWHGWLQRLILSSRDRLGGDWLDAWNEAPVWHFALAPGFAGASACFGVLIPSVDRVGRQFPFTILGWARDDGMALAEWALRAEGLALSALEDWFDPQALDAELVALGNPAAPATAPAPTTPGWTDIADPGPWPREVDAAIGAVAPGESLWWCRGAKRVPAGVLRCAGLPEGALSARLIAGPGKT